jgi:hypothetical protein
MSEHNGTCHCGAVTITIDDTPTEVAECNCSICRRLGTLWHYGPRATVKVTGELTGYVQGDCMLTTWRCTHCGCVTHWTAIDETYDRTGVNIRMFDPSLWSDLPRRFVDGTSF